MEKDIIELLEANSDKWLTSNVICKLLGIYDKRYLRKHIYNLRIKGEPIISNKKGYKIATECFELITCYESLIKRSKEINIAAEGMQSRIEFINGKKIMKY